MIRITDRRITDGTNTWTVTATLRTGGAVITTIHGDVTDLSGIHRAMVALIASKKRYQRAVQ